MMGSFTPMKGQGEFLAFLNFLNNKAVYQKKLDEFQGALDAANEAIGKVTKVKDIEKLWAKANADVEKAEGMRENADAYVEQVSLEAERAAGEVRATALKQAESKLAPLVKREKDVDAVEKQMAKDIESMNGREAAVAKRETTAEAKMAKAAGLIKEYSARSAVLRKEVKDLQDALA